VLPHRDSELQELLDIPVFHDDQHGTAIISCAGLINACHITGRELKDVKVVLCGAGAAGIASLDLMKAMGVRSENCIAVDNTGVIYRGRTAGMNQWKSAHAVDTTPGRWPRPWWAPTSSWACRPRAS
jgi:malate dehydrogenase (oxaloacetate-decarboxylating)(NADP+)